MGKLGAVDHVDFIGGFVGSIPVPDEAKRDALVGGLISLDANVLLSFYRFSPKARTALLAVLTKCGDRLFVPHQSAQEFWRNRVAVIDQRDAATQQLLDQLDKSVRGLDGPIKTWVKNTAASEGVVAQIRAAMADFQEKIATCVEDETGDKDGVGYQVPQDAIVVALRSLLTIGRVGPAPTSAERDQWLGEASSRVERGLPPGFKDAAKEARGSTDGAAGDYLVWRQSLNEAKRRDLPLVIVTGDEKEDWWWRHRSTLLGPRSELVEECHSETGRALVLLRPQDLVQLADALDVKVDPAAAAEIERARASDSVWTPQAVEALLGMLQEEGWPQADVIRTAAEGGGYITRDEIFAICEYDEDRMLRGFTRPVRRLTRLLVDQGFFAAEPRDMLTPDYSEGPVASGFEIPPEVVEILA